MLSFIKNIFKGTLRKACKKGDIEAVKQHLAAGVDVNAKDGAWRTPLHQAAYKGHRGIVELLIAAGADVNAEDKRGGTPLHYAADYGRKEIIELLIVAGADVNAKGSNGTQLLTPLDVAVVHRPEITDLLRKHGGKTGEELKAEEN